MTSRSEPGRTGRIPWRALAWQRAVSALVLTLLALIAFATAFAVGYARIHEGRVLPGVDVAGVPLAGLDRAAAERELRWVLPDLGEGTLTVRIGSEEQAIAYTDIGRDYDMAAMLDQALAAGRDGAPFDSLQEQVRTLLDGMSVPLSVTWDTHLLAERVMAIAAAAEVEVADASISRPGGRFVATPAIEGRAVDEQEAVRLAMAALNNVSPANSTIELEPETISPAVSSAQAQAAADRANAVAAGPLTLTAAATTTTIDASTINGWVHLDESPAGGDWRLVIETGPVAQAVDQVKAQADVRATNASFTFEGTAAVVVPAADGREVDRDAAVGAILAELEARADGTGTATIDLAMVNVAPELSTAQAQALIPRIERLSAWTTLYESSSRNGFGVNITRPTQLIDGTVIGPGEVFDFVAIAGPISEENGYTSGAAIINGNTKLDGVLGGGLCSASTTIFNAAARAGFEIGARRAHAYYIDRYPVGLDATIWINGDYVQTVSFTNDSDYPILIRGINRPGKVTYEIYGVPDGRRVDFSAPQVRDESTAWTRIEYTDDLLPGQTERVEFPFDGFKALVTRTVTDATGRLLHEDVFRSSYRRVIGHVLRGRSPGDPPAGTIIEPDPLPE